jgi:hypothetical protein
MNKQLIEALAWAAVIFALALGAILARKLGYMEDDTVKRVIFGINGLMIAWYGNRTPKAFIPSGQARQLARVSGWSMVLSGLLYAGLWAFAPIPMAIWGGTGVVVAGIAVTLSYALSLRARAKTA